MQVESKKTFAYGFVLDEAELRRIIDEINGQFAKLDNYAPPDIAYRIKFQNGSIADTSDISEVFAQENMGSSQIIRLSTKFSAESEKGEDVKISVSFRNVDLDDESGYTSIQYAVRGNSRDWVFISSTLLEERILRIKRFALNQMGEGRSRRSPLRLLIPLFLMFFIMIPVIPVMIFTEKQSRESFDPLSVQLETAYKEGAIMSINPTANCAV